MTSENESTISKVELYVIQILRNSGFCVVVIPPEEVGNSCVRELEGFLIEQGNHFIQGKHS